MDLRNTIEDHESARLKLRTRFERRAAGKYSLSSLGSNLDTLFWISYITGGTMGVLMAHVCLAGMGWLDW